MDWDILGAWKRLSGCEWSVLQIWEGMGMDWGGL